MILLYYYISEYQSLTDQELNFHQNHKIHYDKGLKKIEHQINDDFHKTFWGENITSVTGIIGKNGTGKTTMIKSILNTCVLSETPVNILLVFKEQKNSKDISFYHHSNIEISSFPDNFKRVNKIDFLDISLIFHSNHFDPYYNSFDITRNELNGKMKNLSTNYLLLKDKETYTNRDMNSSDFTYAKTLLFHKSMELRRQINFIRKYSNNNEIVFFRIPRYIKLSPVIDEESWFLIDVTSGLTNQCQKISNVFNRYIEIIKNLNDKKEIIYLSFFRSSIFNLINYIKASNNTLSISNEILSSIEEEIGGLLIQNKLRKEHYLEVYIKLTLRYSSFSFLFKNIDSLKELFNIIKDSNISEIDNTIYIDLEKNRITDFNNFFNLYYRSDRITSYINLELSHEKNEQTTPSSGELALLNFYSRFHSIAKKDLKRNLIILLDEVELALHPEWQRIYIDTILEYFELEFGISKSIQLIITSHSPFIISDLPITSLNFIKGNISYEQTFGANIHTLLMDAFFIEGGLIGAFAKKKINRVIKDINEGDVKKIKDIRKIINLIGEPVLKNKITQMFEDKFNMPCNDVDFEINRLEARINYLKEHK
ncbi:MAG: AAA family ATPase [Bacteroidota bacterium]